jgi:head-tail adaptor
MPTARDLRDRVRFERRAATSDGLGNTQGAWATLIESRLASLKPRTVGRGDSEAVLGQRLQGTAIFDLWVRYDSETAGVTTDDRVVDARDPTRTFAIRFTQDMDRRRQWLLMQVELGVADG